MNDTLESYITNKRISTGRQISRSGKSPFNNKRNFDTNERRNVNFKSYNRNLSRRSAPANFENFSRYRKSCTILINNLHHGVDDRDILELFKEFGNIVCHGCNYDHKRNPVGTARVEYEKASSAKIAMERYNNITLDGRKMEIQVASYRDDDRRDDKPQKFFSGNKRLSHGPRGFNNHPKLLSNKRQDKVQHNFRDKRLKKSFKPRTLTEEELNNDIDEYNKKYTE